MEKRKFLLRALLTCIGLLFSVCMSAQQITVQGHVKDASGEPIIGANVVLASNSQVGTATDIDGNFTIKVAENSVLTITSIGYKQVQVKATPSLVVTLEDASKELNEVVVIGYGTVKKSDATGSVVAIKADQLNKGLATSPADLLQGKTPGVQITSNSGAPGGGSTIRIRGGSSLKASNDPLIVIDGLPISSTGISGMSDVLSTINPNDIETFTVLKDASATAIYGSRASNGVIVITTKKGTGSKPTISIDMTGSMSHLFSTVDVMDGTTLTNFLTEKIGKPAAIAALGSANTDWQDKIYRTAWTEDINASITGAVKGKGGAFNALPYRLSVGFLNNDGVLKKSNLERTTVDLSLSPQFFDQHLTVNLNGKGIYAKNRFGNQDAISAAVAYDPTQPVYDSDGVYHAWRTATGLYNTMATQNPVALIENKKDKSTVKRFVGNAQFDYKFFYVPGLRANLNLGLDFSTSDGTVDVPAGCELSWHDKTQNGLGLSTKYGQTRRDQSLEYYMNYVKDVASIYSKFDVMAGYSWQHFFNSTHSKSYSLAGPRISDSETKTESYLVSFYGRFNYTFMDRYLLTFTLRDDGTSRFQNNKWGLFPSVALAWRLKEESFLKDVNYLSNLKLRLGYGQTGQQDLNAGDYPSLATYHTNQIGSYYKFGDKVIIPITPNAYDSNLKWETTTTYNAGIDFGFLNDRISGSLDVYVRKTKDLINYVPVSAGTNLSNYVTTNVGNLKNTGFEFALNTVPIQNKDWEWDFGFNLTYNKNKITKLTASDNPDYIGVEIGGISGAVGNTVQIHKVGYAASSFYVYKQVYDASGNPIEGAYVDLNNDGKIDYKDRYVCKKPAPDVFMGFNTSVKYQKWTLSAAARLSVGNYVYDNVASNYEMEADMWTNNFIANRLNSAIHTNFAQGQYLSDYYIHNASFFKLDKITLAYQVTNWARVHFTVQNVFTISKYDGLDPEVASGIDNNMYPRPTTFLLGASLNF